VRILFCNKYNYPFSGTEVYLFEAMELLRSRGHEVALFSMADPQGSSTPYDRHFVSHVDFKQRSGWFEKVRLAGRAIYSREARRRIRGMIADFRPDVAHVRNVYHHLSPSILWELKAQKVPVVYHLNDFKVLCASYNLVLRGEACEACKGGEFWHALKEKCYPGWGARITLVAEAYLHKWVGTYEKCVDRFLAPSEFVRDKFVEHGWDPGRFEVLPHFQPVRASTERAAENAPLLYFGRLSAEKGVGDLLRAMQRLPHLRLMIAGGGPERGRLEDLAGELELKNVEFAGHVRGDELKRAIAGRASPCCRRTPMKLWARRFWNLMRRHGPLWPRTWGHDGNWYRPARQDSCTGPVMWSNWRRLSGFSVHSRTWPIKWAAQAGSECGESTRRRLTTRRWSDCMSG